MYTAKTRDNDPTNSKSGSHNAMPVAVGLFGIGLETYWSQFEGLRDRLMGYLARVERSLLDMSQKISINIVNAGLVDSSESARLAGTLFARTNIDLLVLYVTTYALSSTVLLVLQSLKGSKVPVLVLNLQPTERIDYSTFNALPSRHQKTGEWLANCQACCIPEISCVLKQTSTKYYIVTGTLDNQGVWDEIRGYIMACTVAVSLAHSRVGLMGRYYCGMCDVYTDYTRLCHAFGVEFVHVEVDELTATFIEIARSYNATPGTPPLSGVSASATPNPVTHMLETLFPQVFSISPQCSGEDLIQAAITSCALQNIVKRHNLGAIAYYYEGQGHLEHSEARNNRDSIASIIPGATILTALGTPMAGEYEVKNVIAMKIMDLLGCGGSFSEFYSMDFVDDVLILGHDGPCHSRIAQYKVDLVPLEVYHGKKGRGLSVQMSVVHGPITILSVCQSPSGGVLLLVAEGTAVPGPTLEIGNTNTRCRFNARVGDMVNAWSMAGPSHHCALATGHLASVIHKLALLLGIDFQQV
ncbi:arabinose isomerase [Pelomyxa schiedti]|nr:arabinose isomerase [Pelomyxa schiedti]